MSSIFSSVPFITFSTIFSSCSLVLANKYLYHLGFRWPISLTVFHFAVTYALLEVMKTMKLFTVCSNIPNHLLWLLSAYNTGSIAFMNVNLNKNSVGFYQLSKLATIPVMIVVNYLYYHKVEKPRTLFALSLLLFGLYYFSVNDVQFNIVGCIWAFVAVLCTVASQTYNNFLQRSYNVGGISLQHATSWPQTVLVLITAIILENLDGDTPFDKTYNAREIIVILLTGVISVSVNVSAFAFIGKTSAVTYQVVGHAKTLIIFIIGLILFPPTVHEPSEKRIRKLVGLAFGMIGTVLYTVFQMMDKKEQERMAQKSDEHVVLGSDIRNNDFEIVDTDPHDDFRN